MDNCQWKLWLNNGISCLISFFTGDAATLAMCPVDGLLESWLTWTGEKYVDKKLAAGCCFPCPDQPFIVLQPSSFPACQGCQGRFYAHGWDQNCIVKSIYFIEISLIEGEIKIAGPENVKMELQMDLILLLFLIFLCRRTKFSLYFCLQQPLYFWGHLWEMKEVGKLCLNTPFQYNESKNKRSDIDNLLSFRHFLQWLWSGQKLVIGVAVDAAELQVTF